MSAWAIFGIIVFGLLGTILTVGVLPMVHLLCKSLSNNLLNSFGKKHPYYNLAMMAANIQPEKWEVEVDCLYHEKIGKVQAVRRNGNVEYWIGPQMACARQIENIRQAVLDGQAMAELRAMNAESANELKRLRGRTDK